MPDPTSQTPAVRGRSRFPRLGRREWLVAALVTVLVAGGGAYLGVGYYAYLQLSTIHSGCGTREFRTQTPADFQAYNGDHSLVVDAAPYRFSDFQTVAFPSRGSTLTIRAWYSPGTRGPAGPVVILVHGKDSCRRDPVVMLPAGMLHRAGFAVVLIDMRNHGDSDVDNGRWAGGDKEFRDVLGAWDWLRTQGYDQRRIGLFGTSLGAATVTIAMGEEPRVAATWADSSYADIDTASAEYAVEEGYPGWVAGAALPIGRIVGDPELGTISPDAEVAKLAGRPFAIVQGLADRTVLPHQGVDLAIAVYGGGTKVSPWFVPGAAHTEEVLLVPHEYETRLVAFFTAAIGSP